MWYRFIFRHKSKKEVASDGAICIDVVWGGL